VSSLLDVTNLKRSFTVRAGGRGGRRQSINAVDDISFHIDSHETVALVGESGCGKSTTGLATLRLIKPTSGSVVFDDEDFLSLGGAQLREARAKIQIVLQNPRSQLNPRMTVHKSIAEPLRAHRYGTREEIADRVAECLELVGLDPSFTSRYPHQISGGQRQRVAIARAISTSPKLIVLDEAVSALDVSVQTQVMNLLRDLQQQLGVSYLFISHSMAAVKYVADRVVVMYLGRDVESARADDFFAAPAHPYSHALLSAVPSPNIDQKRDRIILSGDVPSPFNVPSGCVFRTRCPRSQAVCSEVVPEKRIIAGGWHVACHFPMTEGLGGLPELVDHQR